MDMNDKRSMSDEEVDKQFIEITPNEAVAPQTKRRRATEKKSTKKSGFIDRITLKPGEMTLVSRGSGKRWSWEDIERQLRDENPDTEVER